MMTPRRRQFGFTLIEMLVVMGIIVLLAAMTAPSVSVLQKANRDVAARNLIRSQLWLAQAHAASVQKYAGLRFQFDREGVFQGRQYAVQIEKEGTSGNTYIAVPDMRPTALPVGVGVVSLDADNDMLLDDKLTPNGLNGATTFSIIFSPSGQMVIKDVRVVPRNWEDTVFNHLGRIDDGSAVLSSDLFFFPLYDPVYPDPTPYVPWCDGELSATGFYIIENGVLQGVNPDTRFTDYVRGIKPDLINTYTGQLIDEEFN